MSGPQANKRSLFALQPDRTGTNTGTTPKMSRGRTRPGRETTARMSFSFPPGDNAVRHGWRRELAWVAAYFPLSVLFTWPLGAHLGDRLAGDTGDAWQNLWNLEWIRRALLAGHNPYRTTDLWHPDGATLVFQTFDLPDAIWSLPLRAVLGPWAVYDLVVLGTYVFSGASMYLLGRATGASRPAAFLSGAAYTFSTFHFGHALGHLHILAMQWVPLFVLAMWRVLEGGRWRWAFGGGALLVLCSLASWYHLFGAFLLSVALVAGKLARDRLQGARAWVPRAAVLCATYLVLIGPLGLAMLRARAAEPIGGEHSAWFFSADLQSFFLPNAASALSGVATRWRSWTGNAAENATYLGYLLLLLGLCGLALRAPKVGTYLFAALLGVVLSLGPALHVGGASVTGEVLPYARLVKAFPLLAFTGVPVRLAFAATFGLAAALAPALDALSRRLPWKVLGVVGALAVVEHAPHPFVTSAFPTPAPMALWARDKAPFAVLDACRDMRPLWHQVVHQHPIVGGYLTRTPERLEERLRNDPVAGPLLAWDAPDQTGPLAATRLDFPFVTPVVDGAEPTQFSFQLRGALQVPADGAYTFFVQSDDAGVLLVDGRAVVDNGGEHPATERSQTLTLTAGAHPVELRYAQGEGGALVRAAWEGPGLARRVLGPEDVPGGFAGTVQFRRRQTGLAREAALAHLRVRQIRYVVVDARESRFLVETQLGLPPAAEQDGVRIYEVPP